MCRPARAARQTILSSITCNLCLILPATRATCFCTFSQPTVIPIVVLTSMSVHNAKVLSPLPSCISKVVRNQCFYLFSLYLTIAMTHQHSQLTQRSRDQQRQPKASQQRSSALRSANCFCSEMYPGIHSKRPLRAVSARSAGARSKADMQRGNWTFCS